MNRKAIAVFILLLAATTGSIAGQAPPPAKDKALFDTATTAIVKKSRTDICHETGSPNYRQLLDFRAYANLQDCLDSGGKRFGTAGSQIVSINDASAAELETLPGVGPEIAQLIIKGRPYRSVDQLARIKGIGAERLQALRPLVTLSTEPTRNPAN